VHEAVLEFLLLENTIDQTDAGLRKFDKYREVQTGTDFEASDEFFRQRGFAQDDAEAAFLNNLGPNEAPIGFDSIDSVNGLGGADSQAALFGTASRVGPLDLGIPKILGQTATPIDFSQDSEGVRSQASDILMDFMDRAFAPDPVEQYVKDPLLKMFRNIGGAIASGTELPGEIVKKGAELIKPSDSASVSSSRGLFNSSALQALQGSSSSEEKRTADATERTADATEKIQRESTTPLTAGP